MTNWKTAASIEVLKLRAKLLTKVRRFFDSRDYFEVQTPVISRDTTIDRWLEPMIAVTSLEPFVSKTLDGKYYTDEHRKPCFLQTSPEFAMKRLIASGSGSIYQICPAFRGEEYGQRHNPEFTIIEWYGVNDDFQQGMKLLSDLCHCLLNPQFDFDKPQSFSVQFLTYRDAFIQYAHLDPFSSTMAQIRNYCDCESISVPDGFDPTDRDSWLDVILSEKVQTQLGFGDPFLPTILYHYPASQAALAKVVHQSYGDVSERFELFVNGLELANGYHELADPDELYRRHIQTNQQRAADGHCALPPKAILLDALKAGFPPCTGCAMGFDRIVMLAARVNTISEVLSFDWLRS